MMKSSGKGIGIVNDTEEEDVTETLYVDSFRLQQVLADFLLISVNLTPNGGQLVVVASLTKDQLGHSVHLAHLELSQPKVKGILYIFYVWITRAGGRVPEAWLNQMFGSDGDTSEEGISLLISRNKLVCSSKAAIESVNGDISDKAKVGSQPSAEVDLPDAEIGKVRLRFTPEPSGYLQVGHCKEGKAYVDDMPCEEMQKERMDGIKSKCRNNSVYENLKLWKEIIASSERSLQCRLRGGKGIILALRSSEYRDNNARYHRIQKDMGMQKVHIYEFSQLNMVSVIEEPLLLTLTNGPDESFVCIIPRHKKYDGAGEKATTYTRKIWIDYADAECITVDEEVTLMDWGNVVMKEIIKDHDGNITLLVGVLHLEGSVKTTKLKLTRLVETSELVNLSLVEFDCLIKNKVSSDY
ncbi:hypothetical protein CRYUN_Cryun05aG0000500 [Craigia yunnanensis]